MKKIYDFVLVILHFLLMTLYSFLLRILKFLAKFLFYYFLAHIPIIIGVIYIAVLADRELNEVREAIPTFYQEAGFSGEIVDLQQEMRGLSHRYPYTYKEEIGGENWEIDFPDFSDSDEGGSYYSSLEALVDGHYSSEISPFFKETFQRSQFIEELRPRIEEEMQKSGSQSTEFLIHVTGGSDEEFVLIREQLLQDLRKAEQEGRDELRGIASLDAQKYLELGFYKVEMVIPYESVLPNMSNFDLSILPDGYYEFTRLNENGVTDGTIEFQVKNHEMVFMDEYW